MSQNGNHNKMFSAIMVVCAIVVVGATLFSYVSSTGARGGVIEATVITSQQNQEKIVALQITLMQLETQMTQISGDITEIKEDMKRLYVR